MRCICSELIILFVFDTGISLNENCPKVAHNNGKNELYVVLTYGIVYTKNTQVGHLTYLRRHTKKGTKSYVNFSSYLEHGTYENFASENREKIVCKVH